MLAMPSVARSGENSGAVSAPGKDPMLVRALTSPVSQTWAGRLFGREFVTPSGIYGRAHDRALAARAKLLRSIVGALTGRPPNDPLVARGCISTIAPCALLLLLNRRKLKRMLPSLNLGADSAPQLTRHLVDFALAGLKAISSAQPAARR